MTYPQTAGRKKVTTCDIGKPVLTCSGECVGRVESVAPGGSFTVTVTADGDRYAYSIDTTTGEFATTLPPHVIELITDDRIWLRT